MRGVSSAGLEIESWHLLSTWILCQASCICGFIYMPSSLLLELPHLLNPLLKPPSPRRLSPLPPSGLCSSAGPAIVPAPGTALSLHPALCFSAAWVTVCHAMCAVSCLLSKEGGLCLFFSLLGGQHPEQWPAHSRCPVNIC